MQPSLGSPLWLFQAACDDAAVERVCVCVLEWLFPSQIMQVFIPDEQLWFLATMLHFKFNKTVFTPACNADSRTEAPVWYIKKKNN